MSELSEHGKACAEGHHEPLSHKNAWNSESDTVRLWIKTQRHDDALFLICQHCRSLYLGHREIGKRTLSEG